MTEKESARTDSKGSLASLLMLVLLVMGIGLRIWRLSDLGLVHFDEGVYALSALWALSPWEQAEFSPKQLLFSPPLFAILVGVSYRLWGSASAQAAILVNVIIGAGTIPLVWWISRRYFGWAAAIAAGTFVALSNYHIAYSRMALTDVLFGFLFLLSLALIARAFETGSYRWSILAGLAVGAAWNTKYHGWLPLAMALLVLFMFVVRRQIDRPRARQLLWCWVIMVAVASFCYLPWALYAQTKSGGYLALMRYQRSFLSPSWPQNLWRQAGMQWYFDGWLSRCSPAVAYLLCLALRAGPSRLSPRPLALAFLLLCAGGFALGGIGAAIIIAFLVIPALTRTGSYLSWLLLCALGTLFLITPLYKPYPRLLMPWVLSLYVAAGAGFQCAVSTPTGRQSPFKTTVRKHPVLCAVAASLLASVALLVGVRPTPRTWMPTDSVRKAVAQMSELLPPEGTVFVHGAPEVAFYFRIGGRRAIPIDDPIDHPIVRVHFRQNTGRFFLITAIYSQREPRSRASLARLRNRLRLLGVFPIQPNDERLLNDFKPKGALQYRLQPSQAYDLRLYEFDPATIQGERAVE